MVEGVEEGEGVDWHSVIPLLLQTCLSRHLRDLLQRHPSLVVPASSLEWKNLSTCTCDKNGAMISLRAFNEKLKLLQCYSFFYQKKSFKIHIVLRSDYDWVEYDNRTYPWDVFGTLGVSSKSTPVTAARAELISTWSAPAPFTCTSAWCVLPLTSLWAAMWYPFWWGNPLDWWLPANPPLLIYWVPLELSPPG